jgi:hypothetical protein
MFGFNIHTDSLYNSILCSSTQDPQTHHHLLQCSMKCSTNILKMMLFICSHESALDLIVLFNFPFSKSPQMIVHTYICTCKSDIHYSQFYPITKCLKYLLVVCRVLTIGLLSCQCFRFGFITLFVVFVLRHWLRN